ncbi:MAG TPA: elongation factor P [Bacteroidota bacterium]|nr:elongation factor P [Candidatus Kapabacteria bacterium]HRS01973.1 elongation factor P [Bacteroidota bacterium]HRT67952.1 elongation factor P [Bacteroidota bacterium]
MGTTSDLRPGAIIRFNGDLCVIVESEHRTPGNWRAFYQVKMRNIKTGRIIENRFRSGENIEFVRVEKNNYQFLYRDGNHFVFMDPNTYEQIFVDEEIVGKSADFLKEGQEAMLSIHDGVVLEVELPTAVSLKVVSTEPGLRGDTATNVLKPAVLETGATIQVPLFIEENDIIKVNPETGAYLERVNK